MNNKGADHDQTVICSGWSVPLFANLEDRFSRFEAHKLNGCDMVMTHAHILNKSIYRNGDIA